MPRVCVFGCRTGGLKLHVFPNPIKYSEKFNTWVNIVSNNNPTQPDEYYRKQRVCDRHFTLNCRLRNNRISCDAIPTLFLHDKQLPTEVVDHDYCDPVASFSAKDNIVNEGEPPVHGASKRLTIANLLTDLQRDTQPEPEFVDCPLDSTSAMAIVEDEVRNESEEENDIEPVGEEYVDDHDSDDSEDDDVVDEALENKVADLVSIIKADPYSYDDHIELVKVLWALSDLERWRSAFDRVIELMALKPEHWMLRLQTEISLSHSSESRERIGELFEKALEDGYSIEILSKWCSWSLGEEGVTSDAREHLKKVLDCAGADPLSGKVFWDALFEYERAQLDAFSVLDHHTEEYKNQRDLVCRCLEEVVSRPLLRGSEAWPLYEEYATSTYGAAYVARTKQDHELAMEFLDKITPYEDKLLTLENQIDEKMKVYEEYLQVLKDLHASGKYGSRDCAATIKVIYDRATTECPNLAMLQSLARHTRENHSSGTYRRALRACVRRWPRTHHFWTQLMQQAERDEKTIEEVHAYFEAALLRGMETYKEGELLWLGYIEYKRRHTDFSKEQEVDQLRSTFRLAWDSLASCYGEEANDCEVPMYWARLEYQRMKAPKEGKEVFEEIFKYGENRTMSKYWEALIRLEMRRDPPPPENKLRDLFWRALKAVTDYPPAIATIWIDYERDYGSVDSLVHCKDTCEVKIRGWRDYYKTMKDNMTGKKNQKFDKKKPSNRNLNPKNDEHKKHNDQSKIKSKRKSDDVSGSSEVKKKRDADMEVEVDLTEKDNTSQGVKRSHSDDVADKDIKRAKIESEDARAISRESCTLFISNLEFKVNEQNLREHLSQYGDIVSLRVRSGVKAFGGSICYCQYKNIESVDKALAHDRSPLDGRPMFFSRYSANKGKVQFKYATSQENNKLFVKNLPFAHCTKSALMKIFEPHGTVNDIRIVTFKDGKPKGLAYVDYADDESASRAVAATNGSLLGERKLEVAISAPPAKADAAATLGAPKRDVTGGMRRTQLSSFIPSVLQKAAASTSQAPANGDNKPKSNSDFRSLLLASKKT